MLEIREFQVTQPALVLGSAQRSVEPVTERLVVELVERRGELSQALHRAMRDAVATMGVESTQHRWAF